MQQMERPGADQSRALITDETSEALEALAKRYRNAGGMGMQVLSLIGGKAEGLLDRLPGDVRGLFCAECFRRPGHAPRSRRVCRLRVV